MFQASRCLRVFTCWPQFPSLFVWLTSTYSLGLNLVQLIIKVVTILHPSSSGTSCHVTSCGGAESLFPLLESELACDLPPSTGFCRRDEPEPQHSCRLLLPLSEPHCHHVNKPGLACVRIPSEATSDQLTPADLEMNHKFMRRPNWDQSLAWINQFFQLIHSLVSNNKWWCFKTLSFGLICYTANHSWYISISLPVSLLTQILFSHLSICMAPCSSKFWHIW